VGFLQCYAKWSAGRIQVKEINSVNYIEFSVIPDNGDITLVKDGATSVEGLSEVLPKTSSLDQNYPNPFNPSTKIKFSVASSDFVKLIIFDQAGSEVTTLVSEVLASGEYEKEWNAQGYASGVYYYQLTVGNKSDTKKLIILR